MRHIYQSMQRFLKDDKATEVTELAIVLALIVALSIATIVIVGQKVSGIYDLTKSKL